jgi:hypothetical protein
MLSSEMSQRLVRAEVHRRFEGMYCLHLNGRTESQTRNTYASRVSVPLEAEHVSETSVTSTGLNHRFIIDSYCFF